MPLSTHNTTTSGSSIPRTAQSLILLLPTDDHPDAWKNGLLPQSITDTLRGGARSANPMTRAITYHEAAAGRTATYDGDEVYVNTISGSKVTGHLHEDQKEVLRKLFYESRDVYRKKKKSTAKTTVSEWDAEHAKVFSDAFFSVLDPHAECEVDLPCKQTGKRTREGTSCVPSRPALRGLDIIPRVLTFKNLVASRENPSHEPAYDFHTIQPRQANSSTMTPLLSVW